MSSSVQAIPRESVRALPVAPRTNVPFPNLSTSSNWRCELLTDFSQLEDLSEHWERLWQSSRSGIFQKFDWVRAFWKTFGSDLSLCSLVVRNGGTVLGILPLANDGRRIQFLAEGDYNDVLCEEHDAPAVLNITIRELLRILGHSASCLLRNLSSDSRIVRHFLSLPQPLRQNLALTFGYPCPAIMAGSDPDIFLRAARKQSLCRHEKKLRREGRLTFRHIETRREIHQHLPGFFQQQIARRALLGQHSHFQNPKERAFYSTLVDQLNPCRDLRFSVLELEGRPVAYHFGFQLQGKFIWYQTSFDVNLWRCSPGEVLVRNLLQYAHQAGLRELDFTVGGEIYKHRFANVIRNNFELYAERQSLGLAARSRRVGVLVRGGGRRIRERLKEYPQLYGMIKKTWLAAADFISRQRRLFLRSGLTGYSVLALRSFLTNTIYARNAAQVFSIDPRDFHPERGDPGSTQKAEVSQADLSDLALLSLSFPDEFRRADLHSCRKRLERGDRVHLARLDSQPVYLAWQTRQPALTSSVRNSSCENRPGPLVIECFWSASAFRASPQLPYVLRQLILGANGNGTHSAYYITPHPEERQGLEGAGFRLVERIEQLQVLRMFRRSWVSKASKA
jgi:CelD/BcsL family acetyltransferase involved in cellulose biosynthesis